MAKTYNAETIPTDTLHFLADELAAEMIIPANEKRNGIPVRAIVKVLREKMGFPVQTCLPEEWGCTVEMFRVPDAGLKTAELMAEELRGMLEWLEADAVAGVSE